MRYNSRSVSLLVYVVPNWSCPNPKESCSVTYVPYYRKFVSQRDKRRNFSFFIHRFMLYTVVSVRIVKRKCSPINSINYVIKKHKITKCSIILNSHLATNSENIIQKIEVLNLSFERLNYISYD